MNIYRGEWTEDAACAGMGPDMFATAGHERHDAKKITKAKAICATCPVRAECEQTMTEWPSPPYRIVIAGMAPSAARRRWFEANGRDPSSRVAYLLGQPAECGTNDGYQRHMRRGERGCEPCRLAHNARQQLDRKLA